MYHFSPDYVFVVHANRRHRAERDLLARSTSQQGRVNPAGAGSERSVFRLGTFRRTWTAPSHPVGQ